MDKRDLIKMLEGVPDDAEIVVAVEGDYIDVSGMGHDPFGSGENVVVLWLML